MNISDQIKNPIDVVAASGAGAAWLGWAPDIVAVVTGAWVLIRIWETETIKRIIKKYVRSADA